MYLVMELCDAGGIQKLLEKKTRFSEKVCIWCIMKYFEYNLEFLCILSLILFQGDFHHNYCNMKENRNTCTLKQFETC